MMKCSVPGCRTRSSNRGSRISRRKKRNKIIFHRLPLDLNLAKKWTTILKMKFDVRKNNKNIRICNVHFPKESFYPGTKKLLPKSCPKPFRKNKKAAAVQDDDEDIFNDAEWMDVDDDETPKPQEVQKVLPEKPPASIFMIDTLLDLEDKDSSLDEDSENETTTPRAVAIDTTSGSARDSSDDYDDYETDYSDYSMPVLPIPGVPMEVLNFIMMARDRGRKHSSSDYDSTNSSTDYSDEEKLTPVPLLNAHFPSQSPQLALKCADIPISTMETDSPENPADELMQPALKPEITSSNLSAELQRLNLMHLEDNYVDFFFECAIEKPNDPLPRYDSNTDEYEKNMKFFATYINFYAPRGYSYAEERYGVFPPKEIVANWYMSKDYEPGFSKEAFDAITAAQESTTEQLYVHILFDQMLVKSQKHCYGLECVNVGPGEIDDEYKPATRIFLLMATCVTKRWNIPLGFFASDNEGCKDDEIIVNMIELCLIHLEKTGVKVTGVTMPLADQNIKAFEYMGCKFQFHHTKSTFTLRHQDLVFYPDPADILERIRYALEKRGPYVNADGGDIDWMYLDKLIKLQEVEDPDDETRAAQKYLTQQKIQAKLAVNTFHSAVADILIHFEDVLKLPEFKGAAATADFIRIIGSSVDLLNGREHRKIFCSENFEEIQAFASSVCTYIRSLRLIKGRRVVKSSENVGFVGLIFGLKSLLDIYKNVIESGELPYVRLNSFSKDPLELLFSIGRANVKNIKYVFVSKWVDGYISVKDHWQTKNRETGKIVPADTNCMLHSLNTKATKSINYSDRYFTFSTHHAKFPTKEPPNNEFWDHFKVLLNLPMVSEYKDDVMRCIGGYIANLLRNRLKCLQCVAALSGPYQGYIMKWKNQMQTIKYPNKDVLKICWLTERLITIHGLYGKKGEKNCKKISMNVEMEMKDAFASNDASHDVQHRLLLIRAVCELYCDIKRYYVNQDEIKIGKKAKRPNVLDVKNFFK